jgi:radical SAM superfamily enzyme YgiQ (UPF0313 family)
MDYAVISSNNVTFHDDCAVFARMKAVNSALQTIVMGAYPTFFPRDAVSEPVVDHAVLGEPEFVLRRLIQTLTRGPIASKRDIPVGVATRVGGRVEWVPPDFSDSLDDLAIPVREPLRDAYYFNPLVTSKHWTTALTSRGCPGRCVYCTSPVFYGNRYRMCSVEWMIAEVEYLRRLGYDEIFYRDETFTASRKRTAAFCRALLSQGFAVKWICNVRVGTADLALLRLMRAAGCHTIKVGVESGSQHILDNLKKGITLEQTRRLFGDCRRAGLKTHAHVMLGTIGETDATIEETLRFLREIRPTTVTFNQFTPYPGTQIYADLVDRVGADQVHELSVAEVLQKPVHAGYFNQLSLAYQEAMIRRAYARFYLSPRYVLERLRDVRRLSDLSRLVQSAVNVLGFVSNAD